MPFPLLGDLPYPGIKPTSLAPPTLAGEFFTTSTTWEVLFKNRTLCILQCSMKEKSGLKNRYDKKYVFNFGFSVLISKENFLLFSSWF